jgi:hypothetical protein
MNLIEAAARLAQPLLTLPLVRQTRRNHGLEHATIHILSRRVNVPMAGRSDQTGFILLGDLPTQAVEAAARDALKRLRAGERYLAIHPNCGTNLVTTAFMVSAAAFIASIGAKRGERWSRLPLAMALSMIALFASRPIGMDLQRHITTDSDPADTEIVTVTQRDIRLPMSRALLKVHRVETRSS